MAVPTVTGLDPASGPEGTDVLIIGTGFTEDVSRVRFGTYECQLNYTVISDTAIRAIAPAGSGAQTVYVTNPDGTNGSGVSFTFATYEGGSNNAPAISGVAPNTSATTDGEGGDSVVITGNYFSTAVAVSFGPTLATAVRAVFTVDSPTQITATAPRGEPGVQAYVFVENAYGTYSSTSTVNDFYYPAATIPTVTGLAPTSGFPGTVVTITGTEFIAATAVRFGTLFAQFTIVDATTITATVPGDQSFLGSAVSVYVTNPWGESSTYQTFTYASLGALRTTLTLSTGTPAMSPRDLWIEATGNITATLTAVYPPWAGETNVESKWYRLDSGATTKYTGTFTISGEGSHKVEFWAVGKDGVVEPVNVRYVNIVAATTVTGLAAAPGTGVIIYRWNPVKIVGVRYEVVIDTNANPSTLVATVESATYTFKVASPMTSYYCKVRAVSADGTSYAYSSIVGPTTALQTASDLADAAISKAKLATTIQPPTLVDSLPALPDAAYPVGSYVFLTTNKLLYVNKTNTVWTPVVSGSDLTNASLGPNLVPNSTSERDTTGQDLGQNASIIDFRGVNTTLAYRGTRSRRVTGQGTGSGDTYIVASDLIPVQVGDQFYASAYARCGLTESGSYGCRFYVQGLDASLAQSEGTADGFHQSTTWTLREHSHTIAQSTTQWVQLLLYGNFTTGRYGYWDDIVFRRKTGGVEIQDNSILWDNLATDVSTPITTAQSTADGKNKVIYSTSDASGTTGYVTGDIWFKVSSGQIIAQWQFVSGAWSARTLANAVIANLDAGKITTGSLSADRISTGSLDTNKLTASWLTAGAIAAGAIGANEIAADAIFAKQLVVADYENLIQNGNSELPLAPGLSLPVAHDSAEIEFRGVHNTSGAVYAGSQARRRVGVGTGTPAYIDFTGLIPCKAGDKFSFTAMGRMSTASVGALLYIQGYTAAGATTTNGNSGFANTTTYEAMSATYTVPTTTGSGATVWVMARGCVYATAGLYGYWDNLLMRKNLTGSLIVDGTISGVTISGATIVAASEMEILAGATSYFRGATAFETADNYFYALNCSTDLTVYGRIYPDTDFPGVGTGWASADGIWCQDNNSTSYRWKITYNSSARTLSMSRGTTRHVSAAFSVA